MLLPVILVKREIVCGKQELNEDWGALWQTKELTGHGPAPSAVRLTNPILHPLFCCKFPDSAACLADCWGCFVTVLGRLECMGARRPCDRAVR